MLTPPPVAPSLLACSFHTTSDVMVLPLPTSLVPPQARTCGLEAGKSTLLPVAPSVEPLSPAATVMVMPRAAADWHAASSALIACAVQLDSGPPQLIEITLGIIGRVVHRAADRIDEALVGVGREVDNNLCARGDGRRDFDIQHHLAVRAVGVAGRVLAFVHRNRGHLGRGLSQSFEVGGKIRGAVATAQLDDADGLPGGGCPWGKLVKLAHLNRECRRCAVAWAGEALFRPH